MSYLLIERLYNTLYYIVFSIWLWQICCVTQTLQFINNNNKCEAGRLNWESRRWLKIGICVSDQPIHRRKTENLKTNIHYCLTHGLRSVCRFDKFIWILELFYISYIIFREQENWSNACTLSIDLPVNLFDRRIKKTRWKSWKRVVLWRNNFVCMQIGQRDVNSCRYYDYIFL